MSITLVSPIDESRSEPATPAVRLKSLKGKSVVLLDISKRGGSIFLDAIERLFKERYQVASIVRQTKPTFSKPAPLKQLESLMEARPDAIVEALAD
jgi:hypothetical protein